MAGRCHKARETEEMVTPSAIGGTKTKEVSLDGVIGLSEDGHIDAMRDPQRYHLHRARTNTTHPPLTYSCWKAAGQ